MNIGVSTVKSSLGQAVGHALRRSARNAEPFMVTAGILVLFVHPVFYMIWRYVFPQPYENLTLRLVGMLLALPFIFKDYWPEKLVKFFPLGYQIAVIYNLPFLFTFLLVKNDFSQVWVLSTIGAAFVLTLLVEWRASALYFALGTIFWAVYSLVTVHQLAYASYVQYLVILLFPLVVGGIFNYQLQRYRLRQSEFEKQLRNMAHRNARMTQEQNQLLGFFLSNTIISRLRHLQKKYGLEKALAMITGQEQRFCGMMQADVRNFSQMFSHDSEMEVAQLIRRCFTEITAVGQDLTVIKPVGDAIFMYSDDKNGRENTVPNILALAVFFVHSVEQVNRLLVSQGGSPLNFGIAVHAGEAVYGNLASDTLVDPTIIGLNVNQTARMEELTKAPEVQSLAGMNAIIISEEAARYGQNFISRQLLTPIHLDELHIAVRDFPDVSMVYALPREVALAHFDRAMEHIQSQRSQLSTVSNQMETSSYHGIPYYYEMGGMGPNTSWTIMIDVSTLPTRAINDYAARSLRDLDYKVNRDDGQWLILSTAGSPGDYDETDVQSRVYKIIRELEPATHAVHI